MHRRIAVLLALALAVWAAALTAHAKTLRFAPLPMQDQETVVKQFRPLTTYLERRLGVTVAYVYLNSYADIIDQFRRSRIDLAYLGPLPYVELRTSFQQAEPLVRFREKAGRTTYTCALVTFPDNIFDPYDAHNRKIALTQPLSTCGYLSAAGLMRRCGGDIEHNRYRYLKKHDAVALAVIRGTFDAGTLKTAIAEKYAHLGLQVLMETPPLPAFALVGNVATLPAELVSGIRRELIRLDPADRDKEMLAAWGNNIRHGCVPASDRDYRIVRELLGGVDIPAEGNF